MNFTYKPVFCQMLLWVALPRYHLYIAVLVWLIANLEVVLVIRFFLDFWNHILCNNWSSLGLSSAIVFCLRLTINVRIDELHVISFNSMVIVRICRVRMHYGHPDVFDRVFHITRGGISKASRVINLSEDIFAGSLI